MMASYWFISEWEKNMAEKPLDVERLLRALSVTGKLVGFQYAIYMIEQITDDPARVRLITKRLYPETAEQFGTTSSAVERAIRNLIYAVWDRTDHTLLEHIAGTPIKRPPSNSEFLDMLAGYLRNHR